MVARRPSGAAGVVPGCRWSVLKAATEGDQLTPDVVFRISVPLKFARVRSLIRPARQDDAATVSAVVDVAFVIYVPRTEGKPLAMLDDYSALISQGVVHVLEDVGELAGVIVLIPEDDAMLLHCVAVRPDAQGRGLGRLLLTFAEKKAREAGYDVIRLITNPAMFENLTIYKHYGYAETHRGEIKGRHAVYMAKQLSPGSS